MSTGLIERVARAGLTGRGGGAFPTATKLAQAAGRGGRLVINACEGESLSAKDFWLISHRLDGVLTAARAIATALGASRTVIAVHRDSAGHRVLAADARLAASGLELLSVPPRYVSSESSALVSLLDGGLARPITRRVPQSTAGAGRSAPAVVLNLETVGRRPDRAERARLVRWPRPSRRAGCPAGHRVGLRTVPDRRGGVVR